MDIIYLKDLRIDTVIGIYAWEQAITQKICLDIEVGIDINPAAASDDIADTLNYAVLADSLNQFISTTSFRLLESLAYQTAEFLQQRFKLSWLRLKINKLGAVPNAKEVGIIIERRY